MIALLGLIGVLFGAVVIGVQISRGRLLTLLSFHSALFALECGGGAIKAQFPAIFSDFASTTHENPVRFVTEAMVIYIGGYALFLYGYVVATILGGRAVTSESDDKFFDSRWTVGYKALLFTVTFLTICAGFVQHYYRIVAAGGFSSFLQTAYQYRFGTATETHGDTALVVVATIVSSAALPLTLIWVFAWLRGRLGMVGKILVSGLVALLVFRQYTSMFRAAIILTVVAFFATYVSERRLGTARWVMLGSMLAVFFAAVNFAHLYFYYLTAGWDQAGMVSSLAQFLGPHSHIYTLSAVLAAAESYQPLFGTGMLESVFFFVPRSIWSTKLLSTESGTILVQGWAGLPTHFQMAVTTVGEWIAHFGRLGIALMFFNGALLGFLDSFYTRGVLLRAALFGLLMTRVLSDAGMGVSALAITMTLLVVYLLLMASLDGLVAVWRWLFRTNSRPIAAGDRRGALAITNPRDASRRI